MKHNTVIEKNIADKTLHVTREFSAPTDKVWKAWTESSLLDKWWAPRPWHAETKSMDFSAGGMWLYCMVSPEGEKHWCRVGFKTIDPQQNFTVDNGFCDEEGNFTQGAPIMHWDVTFLPTSSGSKVEVIITFDNEADLNNIIAMGFEGGFSMGLGNLDELLEELGG